MEMIREVPRGSGSAIVKASDWCKIDKANAGVVYNKPSTFEVACDTMGSYNPAAAGKKSLIMFSNGLDTTSYRHHLVTNISGGLRMDFQRTRNVGDSGWLTQIILRIRPITAAYDISALTWNSFTAGPPTMGTAVTITSQDGSDFNTGRGEVWSAGVTLALIPATQWSGLGTIYGFVFDVQGIMTLGGAIASFSVGTSTTVYPVFPSGSNPYAIAL